LKPESDINPESARKFDLEQLKFYKSIKYKMLTSFVIGILSGIQAGIVAVMLLISYVGDIPIPPTTVTVLIMLSVFSIALFLWGLLRSLKARI
jgi:hypothetical protein